MNRRLLTAFALSALLLTAACGSEDDSDPGAGATAADATCSYVKDGTTPAKDVELPPGEPDPDEPTTLTISTNSGDIPITLEPDEAPCTVNSFASLAAQGYFDDTQCHRITTAGYFVLQCGDPTATGSGGPGYTFDDELVPNDPRLQPCGSSAGGDYCTYNTGLVAMANRGPNTNGSQFFLVYGPSKFGPDYTVFGHFDAAGLKVVKQIAEAGAAGGSGDGPPKNPVTIESVS